MRPRRAPPSRIRASRAAGSAPPVARSPLEAREVIASRYDESPSGADVLAEPVVVRATGTTVVPKARSRGPRGGGRPAS
ncbi:hypothetical protein SAMN05660642_00756 [Geodermatophilus siccatus]|uniref:Uncharacterized protein n=1 Tax=Geodermatophilus siccatus TaxID=1137991 RepID=A0A1G9MS32_9ACTN|nr:hypothetical protein SAMN05660642_00756 [Geodermatophilus siccatus]